MWTTLISDFGAVLTYPQDDNWVQRMLKLINAAVALPVFKEHYTAFRPDYDAGRIDYATYWQKIAGSLDCPPLLPEQIQQLVDYDIKSWFNINFEMVEFLKQIKPLFKQLVLLSNINYECLTYLEKTCPWIQIFDIKVYSCHEKVVKPDKAIYESALARAAVNPQDCIFIDDNPDNIGTSRKLGINGILFKNIQDLKVHLRFLQET